MYVGTCVYICVHMHIYLHASNIVLPVRAVATTESSAAGQWTVSLRPGYGPTASGHTIHRCATLSMPRTEWSVCDKPCTGVRERARGIKARVGVAPLSTCSLCLL